MPWDIWPMFTINALLSSCSAHLRSVADPGEGPGMGPPYFKTKLRPEGPKKIWGGPGSPPYAPLLSKWLGDWPPPNPFISRSGSGTKDGLLFWIIHIKVGVLVRDSEWGQNEVFIQYSNKIISSEMFKSGACNKCSLPCHQCNHRPHAPSIDTFHTLSTQMCPCLHQVGSPWNKMHTLGLPFPPIPLQWHLTN